MIDILEENMCSNLLLTIQVKGRCRDYNRNSCEPKAYGEWIVHYQLVQETRTGADITLDPASISFITENKDMHCAFAKVLYPEIADLSDEEIKKEHEDKRDAAKPGRFCFQFGGTGYTLHTDKGIPLEEAMAIEEAYKELHYGVYEYGERKLAEAIELGYILSTSGWRLYLPDYEEFLKAKKKFESFDKDFWAAYREGKKENMAKREAEEAGEQYQIKNWKAYQLYKDNSQIVSRYFKKRSEYFKLCLNGPTQTMAAHQTKEAAARIFDHILDRGHQWEARISALQHDEIIMEVSDSLTDEYEKVIETAMIEGGNMYLTSGLFEMAAEAHSGPDWYSAKKGKPKPGHQELSTAG